MSFDTVENALRENSEDDVRNKLCCWFSGVIFYTKIQFWVGNGNNVSYFIGLYAIQIKL